MSANRRLANMRTRYPSNRSHDAFPVQDPCRSRYRDNLIHMGEQRTEHPVVRISSQVIAPDDLEQRLRSAQLQLNPSSGASLLDTVERRHSAIESAAIRAEILHSHWLVHPPMLVRQPGLRGRLAFFTKRVCRRLIAWYVEPKWAIQREFNAEAARFATDTVEAIRLLRREIEDVQFTNERLLRRLHATETAVATQPTRWEPSSPQ